MSRDRSTLALPAPSALTSTLEADLSEMIGKIYGACRANDHDQVGTAYMTWVADLRARSFTLRASPSSPPAKLLAFVFTGHKNVRDEVVGSQFQFQTESFSESYFIQGEIKFTGLQQYLDGNEFERVFPAIPAAVPRAEWDAWGRGATEGIQRRYETVLYPQVIETLRGVSAARPAGSITVWDLGGGTGDLSERICAEVPAVGKLELIEQSETLLEQARLRSARHPGRMTVTAGDLTAKGFVEGLAGAPDVIVLSGVVAQQVMDRAQGLALMRTCHAKLDAGGFAIVPSYSPALLTSRDYETLGFQVHNKTLSVLETTATGRAVQTNDFYIVEKA